VIRFQTSSKEYAVLNSSLAALSTYFELGTNQMLVDSGPIVMGEPSTLRLALAGFVTLALYSLLSRRGWSRRPLVTGSAVETQSAEPSTTRDPSREAA
jgi:hypothetical protein